MSGSPPSHVGYGHAPPALILGGAPSTPKRTPQPSTHGSEGGGSEAPTPEEGEVSEATLASLFLEGRAKQEGASSIPLVGLDAWGLSPELLLTPHVVFAEDGSLCVPRTTRNLTGAGIPLSSVVSAFGLTPHGADNKMWEELLQMTCISRGRQSSKGTEVMVSKTEEDPTGFSNVCSLITSAKNIVILTGAGVSVSAGIPDFRSENSGLYSIIRGRYTELLRPEDMFTMDFFKEDPRPFFDFAKELFPGQYSPTPTHRFIAQLHAQKRLRRLYTQNIDTLENLAGISPECLVQCHGSFASAICLTCDHVVDGEVVKDDIMSGKVPRCKSESCLPHHQKEGGLGELEFPMAPGKMVQLLPGVMKPQITFFGEELPDTFVDTLRKDVCEADLLLVMGTSLNVVPVADIPTLLPKGVPSVLINREVVPSRPRSEVPLDPRVRMVFDSYLLGDCDAIVEEIAKKIGADISEAAALAPALRVSRDEDGDGDREPQGVRNGSPPLPLASVSPGPPEGCSKVFPGVYMFQNGTMPLSNPCRGREFEGEAEIEGPPPVSLQGRGVDPRTFCLFFFHQLGMSDLEVELQALQAC